jgi:sugar/nucleoside kinase (ribokinase family)
MPQVLSLVNVLKADGTEAEFLTGRTNMREAMKILASFGPQEVLLTENQGVTVLANGEFHQAPWKARAIKGRTGRGDTCTAAYLSKRESAGPAEATRFAAALTGIKLEAPGPFHGPVPAGV